MGIQLTNNGEKAVRVKAAALAAREATETTTATDARDAEEFIVVAGESLNLTVSHFEAGITAEEIEPEAKQD